MNFTDVLEAALLLGAICGLLVGLVLGAIVGARWARRRRRPGFDRHAEQALAVTRPPRRSGYMPAASLDAWETGQARRLLDEAFGDQREEA